MYWFRTYETAGGLDGPNGKGHAVLHGGEELGGRARRRALPPQVYDFGPFPPSDTRIALSMQAIADGGGRDRPASQLLTDVGVWKTADAN
jgi:hypothetical protein